MAACAVKRDCAGFGVAIREGFEEFGVETDMAWIKSNLE